MATSTTTVTPVLFEYPKNAREFPKRISPLEVWYGNSNPHGTVISGGVVTSANAPATTHNP
jgi:hypothetical protein